MDRKCQPSLPVQKRLMGYCHHPAGWVGNMAPKFLNGMSFLKVL